MSGSQNCFHLSFHTVKTTNPRKQPSPKRQQIRSSSRPFKTHQHNMGSRVRRRKHIILGFSLLQCFTAVAAFRSKTPHSSSASSSSLDDILSRRFVIQTTRPSRTTTTVQSSCLQFLADESPTSCSPRSFPSRGGAKKNAVIKTMTATQKELLKYV